MEFQAELIVKTPDVDCVQEITSSLLVSRRKSAQLFFSAIRSAETGKGQFHLVPSMTSETLAFL